MKEHINSYYSPSYVDNHWVKVSVYDVAFAVLGACDGLELGHILDVLDTYSDGKFFSFEIPDWIEFFRKKLYLN